MQLLVSWATVIIATLYASFQCAHWIENDSRTITLLGETVFCLTIVASFLISFDSYINAKVRDQP